MLTCKKLKAGINVGCHPALYTQQHPTNIRGCGKHKVRKCMSVKGKGKVLPYSLPSVRPEADPSVQAVSLQVT